MPAKSKYLSFGRKRFSRVLAAILGGYLVAMLIHLAIAKNIANNDAILISITFSGFLLWAILMVVFFLIEKTWLTWLIIAVISALCLALILI